MRRLGLTGVKEQAKSWCGWDLNQVCFTPQLALNPFTCTIFSVMSLIQFILQGFCAGVGGGKGTRRLEEVDGLGWAGQLELSMVLARDAWS